MSFIYPIKSKIIHLAYRQYKKILFLQDPEKVHNGFTNFGEKLGSKEFTKKLISALFNYQNPMLEQEILGIKFKNPIGLSAGFDYEAKLTQILPDVSFGFHTIGSLTFNAYEGNPRPMLGRLPKSRSLLVNKGLKNKGTENVLKSLSNLKFEIPLGISIAKTNSKENSEDKKAINDYFQSMKICEKYALNDYYEINISCPNAFGGEAFTTPKRLDMLLTQLDKIKTKKPIFLKMPVDFSTEQTDKLCKVALKHNIQGLIFGNLTKDRTNPIFNHEEIKKAGKGNFSGLPTFKKSNALIEFAYKKYKGQFIIVGCGGIFNAKDAYEKITLGANLVQMITGMIFQGPQTIGQINHGLVKMLKRDGFKNINEAVGSANKI